MKKTNEVSRLVGVSRRTLQYYDDEGVLEVKRTESNHRLYDEKALETIWRIMLYKEMGLELKEIKAVLSMSEEGQKEYLSMQIRKLSDEIYDLQGRVKLITLVLTHGMPEVPIGREGETFLYKIEALKRRVERDDQTSK